MTTDEYQAIVYPDLAKPLETKIHKCDKCGKEEEMHTVYVDIMPKHDSMKEQSTGSPIINMVPDSGGNCDNGLSASLAGILPLAFLAPLLGFGRGGFGREGGDGGREGFGDLRAEIKGIESGIRETVFQEALNNANKFGTLEKEAAEAKLESKIAALEATNKIEGKIGECCEETQKALCGLRGDMDKQFCHVEGMIEEKFTRMALENKDEKIRALEARIAVQDTVTAILTAIGVPSPIVPFAKKA